jgi:DNA-binding transcriptional MerR regulator
MKKTHYLLNEVANILKLKPYQITYALTVGLVPEPAMRISNKRIFVAADVERLRKHFAHAVQGGRDAK